MYDATIEFGGIHLRCLGRIFVLELQRLQPIAVISGAHFFWRLLPSPRPPAS